MSTAKDLEWSDKFSTDIVSVDRQHQELLYLLQNLLTLLDEPEAPLADKQAAFHDLVDHALEHFAYEEQIMRNIRYPDLTRHVREHDDLRAQIADMTVQIDQGENMDGWKGLSSMIQVWLLRHIVHSDTKIREFIQRFEDEDDDESGKAPPTGERRART